MSRQISYSIHNLTSSTLLAEHFRMTIREKCVPTITDIHALCWQARSNCAQRQQKLTRRFSGLPSCLSGRDREKSERAYMSYLLQGRRSSDDRHDEATAIQQTGRTIHTTTRISIIGHTIRRKDLRGPAYPAQVDPCTDNNI